MTQPAHPAALPELTDDCIAGPSDGDGVVDSVSIVGEVENVGKVDGGAEGEGEGGAVDENVGEHVKDKVDVGDVVDENVVEHVEDKVDVGEGEEDSVDEGDTEL
jgi:hypothetical protein